MVTHSGRVFRGIAILAMPLIVSNMGATHVAAAPLVELTVKGKSYQGRVQVTDETDCWLVTRDGRLERITVGRIETHRQVSPQFRSYTQAETRDLLRRDLGANYDIKATEHYLVAAKKGQAERFSPIFEEVYRSFRGHFSVRGFKMEKPEFPLVAVVCPDRDKFVERCRQDGVAPGPGLLGYYHPVSNRVSLYDPGDQEISEAEGETRMSRGELPWKVHEAGGGESPFPGSPAFGRNGMAGDVRNGLRDTIIHETTHQVAFNTGLHPRIGETPRWVVEGLATVYEAPGIREGNGRHVPVMHRINRERYLRFGSYVRERRPARSLPAFLSGDEMLQKATLDFYSQAWALTFYLVETRSQAYAKYLKALAERDPLISYPGHDRLADFRAAFGADIDRLEDDFLRYIERLEPNR